MTKYTDTGIIDLMEKLDKALAEKYNASVALTGYGEYLETFRSWSEELQEKIDQISNPDVLAEFFNLVETHEVNYFDISFN